jgi:peroxiredoxin Q/BCP
MKVGDPAPDFSALDDSGSPVKLSDFKGRKVVLYFYPKDDTPGCTREACGFRDGLGAISTADAVVLGVSADSVESHRKFREKYGLNFPLLADTDRAIVEDYGVWKEKTNYGKTYMGIERTTYIVDEAGRISHIFPRVKVDGHCEEVVAALKGI